LEQAGNVIDGDGTWLTELPMNLDYVITNEFGERVLSNDQSIGIPTKSKYRFKVKWTQSTDLTAQTRRPHYLLPNVKEYGWINSNTDPSEIGNQINKRKQQSSYYFGLAWSGYTDGFFGEEQIDRLDEIINCEDTFYEFQFNRVYTVSSLIDQYKKGGRGRFIGIKEIDDDSCDSTINKFPVNDGFKNFDLLFFLFSIIFTVIQFTGLVLLIIAHLLLGIYTIVIQALCFLCDVEIPVINVRPFGFICNALRIKCETKNFTIRLPMITYPECQSCECNEGRLESKALLGGTSGVLSYVSYPPSYYEGLQTIFASDGTTPPDDVQIKSEIFAQAIGGNNDSVSELQIFKTPKSNVVRFLSDESDERKHFAFSESLTLGERINIFNSRQNYFDGLNKIKVTFVKDSNLGKFHFDNTITVLSNSNYEAGQLLTTVNPATTSDRNFLFTAQTENGIVNGITGTTTMSSTLIDVKYAVNQTSEQTTTYSLPTGSTVVRQSYPQDREYFQVVTAITIADAIKIWNINELETFPNVLNAPSRITLAKKRAFPIPGYGRDDDFLINPMSAFTEMGEQYILVLQRGVDPYSPKYTNQYGLGKIFGFNDESAVTITASTRLNVPIQKIVDTTISVQKFNSQNDIFYPSYFFKPGIVNSTTPGLEFSSFTTSNVGYYGALDASYPISTSLVTKPIIPSTDGVRCVVSITSNNAYSLSATPSKYDSSEDLSGCGYYFIDGGSKPRTTSSTYYSPNLYPKLKTNPMIINNRSANVMRTDRLPSSDYLDSSDWSYNPALLQQNLGFAIYLINTDTEDFTSERFGSGADTYSPDVEGQLAADVLDSFDCTKMVGLKCYSGNSTNFGIIDGCDDTDTIENGCYVFMEKPLIDLGKDLKSFGEWGYRFRFFYGLCRGVLSQMFVNNWVNGTLYSYPIQVDTFFDSNNRPLPPEFCRDLIHFDSNTNNFYYRSSPYNDNTNRFIGKPTSGQQYPVPGQRQPINDRNLLYPTTIINLGMKNSFYSEITFDPSTKAYVMDELDNTSYSDMSDLVNLFVISRITDENFLAQLFAVFNKNNSLDQLFTRDERRIDGDLAQLMSINSEEGVVNFSPEYYSSTGSPSDPVVILEPGSDNVTMGVFFSSTTEDLQFKDYLTPGRINFRGPNNQLYPYPYGIKSQVVPFYQWKLNNNNTIFGNQYNSWATNTSDIFSREYQSLDRTSVTTPSYFRGSNTEITDTFARGYIFNTLANSPTNWSYSINAGQYPNKFLVGAPFHFYFGLIKGESALDKFKRKYSDNE
jgi:hypothetical protein